MTPFQRAQKEVARWGIPIRTIPWMPNQRYIPGAFNAPSTGGYVLWRRRAKTPEILWEEHEEHACALIHELCHCLVWITTGEDPVVQHEPNFVALERAMSRRCRANWHDWMDDYMLPKSITEDENDWNRVSTKMRHQLLVKSNAEMEQLGLMKDGKPSYALPNNTLPDSYPVHNSAAR